MRQFAWYSPELDTIVLQTFMENCYIGFEWSVNSVGEHENKVNWSEDPMQQFLWFPLGEI